MGKFQIFMESDEQIRQMEDILTKLYYKAGLAPEQVAAMEPFDLMVPVSHILDRTPSHKEIAMLRQVARNM